MIHRAASACPGEKRPRKSATAPSSIDAPWALWAVNAQPANLDMVVMVTLDKSGGHGGGDESLRSMDQKKSMQDFARLWLLGCKSL